MLEDKAWLEWYSRLQHDRIRRQLGFLPRDQGTLAPEDRIQLMIDRGEVRNDGPVTEDSIRKRLHLP
jgi:hypothetical protein